MSWYAGPNAPKTSASCSGLLAATIAARARFLEGLLSERNLARVDRMRPLAAELGVTAAQLSLAWCLRRPEVASVIIGATRAEQLDENALASGLVLPRATLRRLERIFPR